MWLFYFVFWTAVTANEEPLYRKTGDKVVLTPDSVETTIYRIRWKHGDDIAVEWRGDETVSYRQFKDRGSLDISTGEMTITGLTGDESGVYTVEINNKENRKTELLVIFPVPKPTISLTCDPEITYCILTCDGDTTGAEPVTYWWTAGDMVSNSTKELRITEEDKEQWFSCALENQVSFNSSERVSNPLMKGGQTWISILIGVLLVILVVCIISYLMYKYKVLQRCHQGNKPQWQYEGKKKGEWCDYIKIADLLTESSVTSNGIQKQYQQNRHSSGTLKPYGDPNTLELKEMAPMLQAVQGSSDQGQTSDVTHSINNGAAPDSQSCHSQPKPPMLHERQPSIYSQKIGDVSVSSVNSDDIETCYQENPKGSMTLTLDGAPYELNFKRKIQINLKTTTKRRIRRMKVESENDV